ncbi:MAG: antibiotic biosynthesis monooxygenase [Bryobacterales bacterium]|nr:antibiotic biosynthesis monooxygenase [Bryobacterales bacterium]
MQKALLTVVAEVYAKPGHEDRVRRLLQDLIEPTRREEGFVQYDLHVDNDNLGHFIFYENWASREQLQAHLASPHLTDFDAKSKELLAEPVRIVFATRIG